MEPLPMEHPVAETREARSKWLTYMRHPRRRKATGRLVADYAERPADLEDEERCCLGHAGHCLEAHRYEDAEGVLLDHESDRLSPNLARLLDIGPFGEFTRCIRFVREDGLGFEHYGAMVTEKWKDARHLAEVNDSSCLDLAPVQIAWVIEHLWKNGWILSADDSNKVYGDVPEIKRPSWKTGDPYVSVPTAASCREALDNPKTCLRCRRELGDPQSEWCDACKDLMEGGR